MPHGIPLFMLLVLLVAAERVVELVVSRRHERWAAVHGGVEYGKDHYPYMVGLHIGLLVGCVLEVWLADRPIWPALAIPMLLIVLAAQALRWWCIATLGSRWTTRVIVLPGVPPIRSGPYRYLAHPNYLAVMAEGFALPMVGFAWITAVSFTVLNLVLLNIRVAVENAALDAAFPPGTR